jgi:hypothetical protein
MSLSIYPTNSISNLDLKREEIFTPNKINLTYELNKIEFEKIIQHILIDFCNMTVLGYDKREDKYWCKKCYKSSCLLYIKIQINVISFDFSKISILPIIWNKDDINMFVYDFNDSVKMYKTSNFIKSLLHKC